MSSLKYDYAVGECVAPGDGIAPVLYIGEVPSWGCGLAVDIRTGELYSMLTKYTVGEKIPSDIASRVPTLPMPGFGAREEWKAYDAAWRLWAKRCRRAVPPA